MMSGGVLAPVETLIEMAEAQAEDQWKAERLGM